jgi:hypothetical protein
MRTNEHGSRCKLILVNPNHQQSETNRKAKTFKNRFEALSYALEGDQILEIFEDGTVCRSTRFATGGAQMGIDYAIALLNCSDELDKGLIISMCNHTDAEVRGAFLDELVSLVIELTQELREP